MGCIDMNAWYSRRQARPSRLRPLRPRPLAGRRLSRDDRGGAPRASGARVAGARVLCEDERITRHSRPGAHRASPHVRGHPSLRRGDRRSDRAANLGLATTEWSKKKRRGVLIDANQNGAGKTIASAYSVRPRAGAPVSTPLRWDEVRPGLDPAAFTMDAVLDRVAREGDLFEPVLHGRQSLARALKALR